MDPTREEEDLASPSEGTFGNVTIGFMPVTFVNICGTN